MKPELGRLAGVATVLSLIVCFGTLALTAILAALGIAIAVNNTLWSGAIVAFAALAVIGLGAGLIRHRKPWPFLTGGLGAAVIAYAMYVHYDRTIEMTGFLLLSLAAIWDWQLKKTRHTSSK